MIVTISDAMRHSKSKFKRIIMVWMLVILCTACGTERPEHQPFDAGDEPKEQSENLVGNNTETANIVEKSMENGEITSQLVKEDKEKGKKGDYRIIKELYIYTEQRNDISIYFPQLSGLGDTAKEERINALIEEDVKKIIGEKNKEGDDTLYCIDLDFEVKFLNERIISILYKGQRGYIMPGRARMIGKAIGTTIDIEEEKIITLKDVVTDFPKLRDLLLADEFENITMWEGKMGTYEVSWEYGRYEDKGYEIERDLQEEERKWYTDGNNFIVILEEFQDYNEYSISNESVKHILDEEFLDKLGYAQDQIDDMMGQKKQEVQCNESLRKEKYNKESGDIWKCLVVNVPEILNEWNDYIVDRTDGEAYITTKLRGDDINALTIDKYDVYRDDEETAYLGKYYLVYVGEQWEEHTVYWANFYVSEDFDEVLWCDFADIDDYYSALYLDEWRNSRYYRKLDK